MIKLEILNRHDVVRDYAEPRYFKQLNEPELIRIDADGTKWYYINVVELGKPLN